MKQLFYIICTFHILFSYKGICQSISDPINISTINKSYLEQLIKTKIDSVRIKNKRPVLANDSILYLTATYHANYLLENNILSHTEKKAKMKTPQTRAEFFGANNFLVGENIAFTYVNELVIEKNNKHTNITYQDAANDFVNMWVHSPGHFSNIINKDYTLTAIAISFDEKTNRVYAVQNFAWIAKK